MADILKKYRNKSGYTIRATEKAYNLFYKKQGFVPVEDSAASDPDVEDPAASDLDEKDSVVSDPATKEPAKKGKGKSTKAADKDATEPEAPAESAQEE